MGCNRLGFETGIWHLFSPPIYISILMHLSFVDWWGFRLMFSTQHRAHGALSTYLLLSLVLLSHRGDLFCWDLVSLIFNCFSRKCLLLLCNNNNIPGTLLGPSRPSPHVVCIIDLGFYISCSESAWLGRKYLWRLSTDQTPLTFPSTNHINISRIIWK